jgi:hypothetical protein
MNIKTFFSLFFCFLLNFAVLANVDAFAKISSKLHVYTFWGCTPGMKSNHSFDTDESQRFQVLDVKNYSVAQLFSMAILEGISMPKENIVIPNGALRELSERHCYRIAAYKSNANEIYKMMLSSLHGEFPGYSVTVEIRSGKKFLVFKYKS